MRVSNIGFGVLGGVAALGAVFSALVALSACGAAGVWTDAGAGGGSSGGNCGVLCPPSSGDDGGGGSSSGGGHPTAPAVGTVVAPDCQGCTFPPAGAPACAASAPAIKIVYPPDNVLVPPNLNVMSVHWTPFGGPFTQYEVDFSQSQQSPNTDWHIVTACKTQTVDAQSGNPSQGCELVIDPVSWSSLVAANRGASNPMAITVRGTTDGNCATTSTSTVHMSFSEEDLIGTYYYWKSTVTTNGVGGQIWAKDFGDIANGEKDVTTAAIQAATCNGCHSLSRDGSRMVVYSDDDDSDDEYSDVAGSYLNMTTMPNATEFPGGVTGVRMGGQPPGFSTINPLASFYVSSNGYPCGAGGRGCGTSNGYPGPVPTNGFSVWNGTNGAFVGGVTIGPAGQRPTMPDWSVDGTTVVYVQPAGEFAWRTDDAHIFGGSLYTVPYMGNGVFGTPAVFLQSGGENNYYPSYSPDNPMSYIIFNRVDNMGGGNGCNGGFCPNDSFSNPAARLMLVPNAAGAKPIDMERANGSPASAKVPLSNSYPRWAPFVQTYHGNKLLWFTFSSTRDYGVRVLNHKTGMFQCYPADAAETPGGAHRQPFGPSCQEPQLWMAPITSTEAQSTSTDPSGVAFWIPYQDIKTHNHTAQWTVQNGHTTPPPGTCVCATINQACATNACGCCSGLTCSGNGVCINGLQ